MFTKAGGRTPLLSSTPHRGSSRSRSHCHCARPFVCFLFLFFKCWVHHKPRCPLEPPSHAALKMRVCSSLLRSISPFLFPPGGFARRTGPSVRMMAFIDMYLAVLSSLYD